MDAWAQLAHENPLLRHYQPTLDGARDALLRRDLTGGAARADAVPRGVRAAGRRAPDGVHAARRSAARAGDRAEPRRSSDYSDAERDLAEPRAAVPDPGLSQRDRLPVAARGEGARRAPRSAAASSSAARGRPDAARGRSRCAWWRSGARTTTSPPSSASATAPSASTSSAASASSAWATARAPPRGRRGSCRAPRHDGSGAMTRVACVLRRRTRRAVPVAHRSSIRVSRGSSPSAKATSASAEPPSITGDAPERRRERPASAIAERQQRAGDHPVVGADARERPAGSAPRARSARARRTAAIPAPGEHVAGSTTIER